MKTLEEMKAEFAARGGQIKTAETGIAYGVSADADRAKRADERARRDYEQSERRAEQYAEQTREAYHVGGSRARDEVVRRWAR